MTSFEYQVLLANAWVQASEQLIRGLAPQVEKGEPVRNLRQMLQLWVDEVDQVFNQLFRSEE